MHGLIIEVFLLFIHAIFCKFWPFRPFIPRGFSIYSTTLVTSSYTPEFALNQTLLCKFFTCFYHIPFLILSLFIPKYFKRFMFLKSNIGFNLWDVIFTALLIERVFGAWEWDLFVEQIVWLFAIRYNTWTRYRFCHNCC